MCRDDNVGYRREFGVALAGISCGLLEEGTKYPQNQHNKRSQGCWEGDFQK